MESVLRPRRVSNGIDIVRCISASRIRLHGVWDSLKVGKLEGLYGLGRYHDDSLRGDYAALYRCTCRMSTLLDYVYLAK